MANAVFYIWIVVNGLLFIHVIQEFVLMIRSLSSSKRTPKEESSELPTVTIQLPLYNEKYVVERLLLSIQKIEYPKDKLEVQILDDSTDETSKIIQSFCAGLKEDDFKFNHIQREDRTGFKAGALSYGMKGCTGEFIAIFDADFIPEKDFLLRTVPFFSDEKVGLVQSRWQHINEDDSLLTRAQAVMLNTHFGVEQLGRSNAKGFINFNGTAGIWRKQCIEDAGGWQADTLTEDLDLSFRAQVRGWKFEYLFEIESPAELPVTFEAYRTQQFRWSKGAAECLRKNAGLLWNSKVSFGSKLIGTFHLMNSSVYLLVVAILILSPVVFYLNAQELISAKFQNELTIMGASVIYLLLLIFFVGNMRASSNKVKAALWFVPSALVYFAMTTGISLYMVFGVIEGYRGKKSAFVRTPKFGSSKVLNKVKKGYDFKNEYGIVIFESISLLYGVFWTAVAIYEFNLMSLVYGLIILVGFSLSLFFKKRTFRWSS